MTLLLERDGGKPDRNEVDPLVAVGELGIIYGLEHKDLLWLNGKEVNIKEALSFGVFVCDVDGVSHEVLIHHKNLMHMDVEDIIIIDNYDDMTK